MASISQQIEQDRVFRDIVQNNQTSGPLMLPPGFGDLQVPEMPAYVQGYSKRGNTYDAETTPVMQQMRFGNRVGVGGMNAYLSQVEDPLFFESCKQKKGNQGVFEEVRWNPGYDWRGNYGISSLNASKNYAMSTRGGQLRKGGPRRSDVVDRIGYWFETARPGIEYSRYTQNNDNYSGVYEWKRRTPFISRDNDPLVLREMIEHNPFHIVSHSAIQAKEVYDREFGTEPDSAYAAYRDDMEGFSEKRRVVNEDPYLRPIP